MEWANIVKKGLHSNIITVKYDEKNNCINLDLITDQARKSLNLNNSNDFKSFSRNTKIYENSQQQNTTIQNSNTKVEGFREQKELSIEKFESNQNKQMTLENKIICIIKQHIKQIKENDIISQKNKSKNKINEKQQTSYTQTTQQQTKYYDFQQIILYGEYLKDEYSEAKTISIKITIYQNQTEWFCCLVLNEENSNQKLKILKEIDKTKEANFFRFCVYLGQKLQDISLNIQNVEIIKANIYQCYNMMYNFKNYCNIIKNELKFKPEKSSIKKISLESLKIQIVQCFINQMQQIKINFQFLDCCPETLINTHIKYLYQIIMNIVENSINLFKKSDFNNLLTTTPLNTSSKEFTKCFQYSDMIKDRVIESNISLINQNILLNQSNSLIRNYNNDNTNIRQSQLNLIQDESQYQNNYLLIPDCKEINIKIELIKGENDISNIFKISVYDNSKGQDFNQVINLLQSVSANNPYNSFSYQLNNFVEWKVNYFLIGKLGPFYNFYIQNNNHQVKLVN
ncbi:hypothetical protein ABPG72_007210 [Tetrahymena utriculariae]